MARIISLGLGAYVDAEQIVAVDDAAIIDEASYKIGYPLHAKSTILLKDGVTIPGYVKPETVKKRWQEALGVPERMLKRMEFLITDLEKSIEQDKLAEEDAD